MNDKRYMYKITLILLIKLLQVAEINCMHSNLQWKVPAYSLPHSSNLFLGTMILNKCVKKFTTP